jgi:arylformamidase
MAKNSINNTKYFALFIIYIVIFNLLFMLPILAQETIKDIRIYKDIPYAVIKGVDPNFTSLDIYTPLTGGHFSVIVFIHGGTWVLGNKGRLNEKIKSFVKANYVYVSINYRLSPDAQHPLHAIDVAKAVTWIYEHISDYSGDPLNIFLLGHSAGGHLAALIALDDHYLKNLGFSNEIIRGIIGLDSAAYHLPILIQSEPENNYLFEMAFGNNFDIWEKASPINYVEKIQSAPSFLLIYAGDREVSKVVNLAFFNALRKSEHEVDLYYSPDKNHVSIERDLGKSGDITTEKIFQFIHKHLKNQE